jgi:hypothetical protein
MKQEEIYPSLKKRKKRKKRSSEDKIFSSGFNNTGNPPFAHVKLG